MTKEQEYLGHNLPLLSLMLFFCLLLQLSVTTTVYTKENVLSLRVARVLRDTAGKDVRYVSMLARRRKLVSVKRPIIKVPK